MSTSATRYDATAQASRLGHQLRWSPEAIPGDVANGCAFCEQCGLSVEVGDNRITGPATTDLCHGLAMNVQDYLWNSLSVKSNKIEMRNCLVQSIVGQGCKEIIDAARILIPQANLQDLRISIKAAVVRACEIMYFG